MPAMIVRMSQGGSPSILAVFETEYIAKKFLVEHLGNPAILYNIQKISIEQWTALTELFTLPNYDGYTGD